MDRGRDVFGQGLGGACATRGKLRLAGAAGTAMVVRDLGSDCLTLALGGYAVGRLSTAMFGQQSWRHGHTTYCSWSNG